MKSLGIVRHLDELGRIVIPKELRKEFNLNYKDGLEIFVKDKLIILKKYENRDIFNGDDQDLIEYNGKKVSLNSIKELTNIAREKGFDI